MSAADEAYEKTLKAQRAAADPSVSAFISANAGAGKTRVLTNRVARLLLSGARPDKILCLTFTKAAAAEMASRLYDMLGEWALADDATLTAKLDDLEGEAKTTRDAGALSLARRLFARALETPGGLKIQTIHSFSESLLKRFPIEAGVAPGFSVIEESEARALARDAVERVAVHGGGGVKSAVARLADIHPGDTLRDFLVDKTVSRQEVERSLASAGGWRDFEKEVVKAIGAPDESEDALVAQAVSVLRRDDLLRAQAVFKVGGGNARKLAAGAVQACLDAGTDLAMFAALEALFFDSKGKPKEKYGDNGTRDADPGIEPLLCKATEEFAAARDTIFALRARDDARDFFAVLEAAWARYGALKAARAALDYDDLIARAAALLSNRAAAQWVLYKLDAGIDHILLDEAQDTSPGQWAVIEGPLEEFFSGDGASGRNRTFFAVGDQKQSIYSFQGADASLFQEKRVDLGKKIETVAPYVDAPLTLSFRTTAPVLNFVDAIFENDEAREGLEDEKLRHDLRRIKGAGSVELWPLTPHGKDEEPNPWDAPVDQMTRAHPVRTLTSHIASTIADAIETKQTLTSKARPVRAGDFLILVQSRAPLFHEMIRALSRAGVPVAGADRLKLLEDAAVEDMLAFARAALLYDDDLSLAETLKSPFFGFTDDDLLDLAPNRKGALAAALSERAAEKPHWAKADRRLRKARSIAEADGAFAFFAHILDAGAPSGRSRLYARLGEACRETIGELLRLALDHERRAPRSLQQFLAWLTESAGEIKREMDEGGETARVMTVHGAKGLEAPIVYLIDAQRTPQPIKGLQYLKLDRDRANDPSAAGLLAIARSASENCTALAEAREEEKRRRHEEYRRLFYVAATRARDHLVVCGVEPKKPGKPESKPVREKTWHALAKDAFVRLGDDVERRPLLDWGDALRIACDGEPEEEAARDTASTQAAPLPAWLDAPAPAERGVTRIAPSALVGEDDAHGAPAYSPGGPKDRFLRGRTLHKLLELLPEVEPAQRSSTADRLLARHAPEVPETERAEWREEALRVIRDPAFAEAFAPGSRAEVSIAGAPRGAREGVLIAGQIDRLAVSGESLLIVDYKTNRPPPLRVEDADPAYLAQLAAYRALLEEIYPRHQIRAGLLWTYDARLMEVPSGLLDHAFARWLA